MLKPIKIFYSEINPNCEIFEEAKQIVIDEDCVVEVRWFPNMMCGWYHEYVFDKSDSTELASKVPKVYGW